MRSIPAAALLAGCGAAPAAVSLPPQARVVEPAKPVVVRPVVPESFLDEPPEGPYASLDAYCREVLARDGNDAPRFCDPDPALAQHAHIPGARFVAHDAGGDFVFCSLALETARGWYVLHGFECSNTMNDDRYDFHVTELSREAKTNLVVKTTVTVAGSHERTNRDAASAHRACRVACRSRPPSTGAARASTSRATSSSSARRRSTKAAASSDRPKVCCRRRPLGDIVSYFRRRVA